jgi:putative SOS response-associated peptidase YedK
MCGRYVVIDTVEAIEKRFNVKVDGTQLKMNYNLPVGEFAPVITDENPNNVQFFQFGLTPSSATKRMYYFNARSENIIYTRAFQKPIRSQRCLVIASAFIEGPEKEKLSKPYLVYLRNKQRPFAMAGIWDIWNDQTNGELLHSFSILTISANECLQKIGHQRMPVILQPEQERIWLKKDVALRDVTRLFNQFPFELMNAYPIDPLIKHKVNNYQSLIEPKGERIFPEYEIKTTNTVELQGFGHRKKHKGDSNWGDRFKKI